MRHARLCYGAVIERVIGISCVLFSFFYFYYFFFWLIWPNSPPNRMKTAPSNEEKVWCFFLFLFTYFHSPRSTSGSFFFGFFVCFFFSLFAFGPSCFPCRFCCFSKFNFLVFFRWHGLVCCCCLWRSCPESFLLLSIGLQVRNPLPPSIS